MKYKRNENGKIDLYLGRDMGRNMVKVGEFDSIRDLRAEGRRLLKANAECANSLPAREFAYLSKDKTDRDFTVTYEWVN